MSYAARNTRQLSQQVVGLLTWVFMLAAIPQLMFLAAKIPFAGAGAAAGANPAALKLLAAQNPSVLPATAPTVPVTTPHTVAAALRNFPTPTLP